MDSLRSMKLKFLIHILLCCICTCYGSTVEVHTKLGTIIGNVKSVEYRDKAYKVKTFLGIPYAKPPVGDRRFQKPEVIQQYSEAIQAFKIGRACPQLEFPGMHPYTTSEDCLYLNIFVPEMSPDKGQGHAVMVFIHGGGFTMGAGESFVGDRLATFGNVIYVSINYRIGVFGFMDSGDGRIPGNLGLHDQHLALKWINENIEAFGGDKERVTIFGESAGGSSVVFQGLYPPNEGLFQRLICQSGVPSAKPLFVKNPKDIFDIFAREIGCDKDVADEKIDCLKVIDTDTIMEKVKELAATQPIVRFLPTVDGEIVQIPTEDLTKLSNQETITPQVEFYRSLDVTIGFNDDEGAIMLLIPFYPFKDNETYLIPRDEFSNEVIPHIMAILMENQDPLINKLVVSHYTNWSDPDLPENNRLQYVKLLGDIYFTVGSTEFVKLHANSTNSNTHAYYFTAKPTNRLMKTPDWIQGANHVDEMNYIMMFDPELNKMLEDKKPLADWEYELTDRMVAYWTNFAKTGNPNEPENVSPYWPNYDIEDHKYIILQEDMSKKSVGKHLYEREVNFWLNLVPEVTKHMSHDHEPASPFVKKPEQTCSKDRGCE